jgi:hypothetical protein
MCQGIWHFYPFAPNFSISKDPVHK